VKRDVIFATFHIAAMEFVTHAVAVHAAFFRLGLISTSAEMPRRSCRRRIIAIDSPRLGLRTSAMRVRP
jgi:hypothetical protein